MLGLSNLVALEGADHGIRSNVVMPQVLDTSMGAASGQQPYPSEYLDDLLAAFKPFLRYTTVRNVTPLVVCLAHRTCDLSQQIFSVGCGHVARVLVGVAPVSFAPELILPEAEDLVSKIELASARDGYAVPGSATDELTFMNGRRSR